MVRVIISAFVLIIALLLGVTVVDTLTATTDATNKDVTRQAATLGPAGTYTELNDGIGKKETVYKTTGYAVNLTGADDSFVESDSPLQIATDKNWTVSMWGYVDAGNTNSNLSAISVDGRLIITYNGSVNEWQGWYYDEGSRDSYIVSVPTSGNETGNFTNIMVRRNFSHLTIYRNNTQGETQNLSADSIEDAPVNATNWDGRLEEVRAFDRALNSSNRDAIVNTPVEQQPHLNTTARIMFDQPDKETQFILYSQADLSTSNVSYSDGFPKQIMDKGEFANLGADYTWDSTGPQLKHLKNGELDGAPVAYASYSFGVTGAAGIIDAAGNLTELAALVPIIAILLIIVGRLRGV